METKEALAGKLKTDMNDVLQTIYMATQLLDMDQIYEIMPKVEEMSMILFGLCFFSGNRNGKKDEDEYYKEWEQKFKAKIEEFRKESDKDK